MECKRGDNSINKIKERKNLKMYIKQKIYSRHKI
jgi:hypothetical protein